MTTQEEAHTTTPAETRRTFGGAVASSLAGAATARSIFVGIVCVTLLSAATVYSDLVIHGTTVSTNALPIGALAFFVGLVGIANTLARRISSRLALTSREVLLVYVMMLVAQPLPSVFLTIPMIETISQPAYLGIRETRWVDAFFRFVPDWFWLTDRNAAVWFFERLPPGERIPWGQWATPLAAWGAFGLLWFFAYFCLAALVRRQWVERERLAFPLAELPLEIARGDERPTITSPFFRSGLMWLGFSIPWLLYMLNGLQRHILTLPSVQLTGIPLCQGLTNLPWSMLRWQSASFYFSVIGLTYLISSQISGSAMLFYVLTRIEILLFAAAGITATTNADPTRFTLSSFFSYQQLGAMLVITGISFWSVRHLLVRRPHTPDGFSGPLGLCTEQWAILGFLGSFALMGIWGVLAGVSFVWQVLFVALYTFSAFALVRAVAAGGFILLDVNFLPIDPMLQCFSTAAFSPRQLTIFSFEGMFCWWNPGWANGMQYLSHGLRITTSARLDPRRTWLAVGAGCLIATALGCWLTLELVYRGIVPRSGTYTSASHYLSNWHLNKLLTMLQNPVPVQWHGVGSIALGAAMMWLLSHLNRRFIWFTLNPLGYVVGVSWVMDMMWASILLGWLLNAVTCRYLGLNWYRRLRPFFLGLILGEFLSCAQWVIIDAFTKVHNRTFFPSAF